MTIQGDSEEQDPNYLPASLPQEIIFEFNQTYREQTFDFSLSNLELSEFNSLIMFFVVSGDRSTSEGLDVVFLVNYSKVNFTINRLYQDNLEHNLSQTFAYPENFIGEMNITVACKGQTVVGESGILVIHSSTIFNPLTPPTLTQQLSSLPTVPDSFSVEGSFFSTQRLNLLTAFYSYNETAEANITLTFISNSSYALQPVVEFQLNDELAVKKDFEVDEFNSLSLSLSPKSGLNFLSLVFVYKAASGLINVQDIHLFACLFFNVNDPTDCVYDWVKWESETLNHTFNLSSLKPETYSNEQIVNLRFNCKYKKPLFSPSIVYQILAGTRVVHEGTIYYFGQLLTHLTLSAKFVSTSSQEELLLRLFMDQESTGTFSIFNSSTITLDSLPEFNNGCLEQLLSSNLEITPPAFGMISLSFTNFFKTTNYSLFDLTIQFNILSEYEEVFDYVIISLKLNNSGVMYLRKDYQSTINETTSVALFKGIYEIKLTLTLFGIQSPFSLQNITYQFLATSYEPPDTFVFNWYNIDWILAIYGFLFLMLNEKIISRRGMKRKAREENFDQSALEEEEEEKKERIRFILKLAIAVCAYGGFVVLLYLFQLLHWSLIVLATLCSYYLSSLVDGVSFEKGKIKKLLVKFREFFDEVESFYDLFSKTIETLSRKSRKQIWRATLIALIIGSLAINVGMLFFVADKLQFITEEPNLFSFFFTDLWQAYYFLFACVIVSTLAIYYAIHFVKTMAFVEDNLRRTRFLGKTSIILLTTSLLSLNVIILGTISDFSTLWTFLSPLFFLGVVKASNNLGEVLTEEEKDDKTTRIISLKEYLRNGKVWTNKREMRQALSFGITTRTKWLKEKHSLQKKKLNGTIIWNITAGIQVPLARLAELTKLTKKRTELLLLEILNEQPKLGKYYKEEQVFIKETTDDTIGTVKMTEDEQQPATEKKGERGINQAAKLTVSVIKKFQEMFDNTEGKDDIQKLSSLRLKFHLTAKEAEAYLNFIKKGMGEKEVTFTNSDREFLQRAWKKIHVIQDAFQRNSSTNLMREHYESISKSHNGFDDIVFLINNQRLYDIIFIEYKTGDNAIKYPWKYIPKYGYHLQRRDLNRKQIEEYFSKRAVVTSVSDILNIMYNKFQESSFITKLFYDRNRQYYSIGNDWLIKLQNGDFQLALKSLVRKKLITNNEAKNIIKGLYEQNQIIGLAQNGHILKLENYRKIIEIIDKLVISVKGKRITLSHEFFLPRITASNGKTYLTLNGFQRKLTKIHRSINKIIGKREIKSNFKEDKILIIYSEIKRIFLDKFFTDKYLNSLRNMKEGRCRYGLDLLTSNSSKSKSVDIIDKAERNRGLSWFYDDVQQVSIDFLRHREFISIIGEEEDVLYDRIINMLIDPETFFERNTDYVQSAKVFKRKPFQLFLFYETNNDHLIPPTFSFRRNVNPKTGVILVDDKNDILHYGSYAKRASIQLSSDDILLNFPFRWDSNYGYFSFTQKGNKLSIIGESWNNWLEQNGLVTPTGASGKIPSESVVVMLLEWWNRQLTFVKSRILEANSFKVTCSKNDLVINPDTIAISDKCGNQYKIAKVSIRGDDSIQHKNKWKLFAPFNKDIVWLISVLESFIFEIMTLEKKTNPDSIINWKKWLSDNWINEFEKIRDYFLLLEEF